MKITADKKYFIIENQFDKLPAEIIDYIYFFVDNYEPHEEHKNFVKNDLLFFIKVNKIFYKGFKKIRFLSNNTIILNKKTKCNYHRIKDVNDFSFFIEESFKNNVILTNHEINNYDMILKDFFKKNIFSFCNTIYDFKTILKKKYYYKNYNEMLKKPSLKKLNKLIKEKNNVLIFEMIEYYKLKSYLCNHRNFTEKDFFDVYDCFYIDNDEYILFTKYYY
jgi:hypothetical protein